MCTCNTNSLISSLRSDPLRFSLRSTRPDSIPLLSIPFHSTRQSLFPKTRLGSFCPPKAAATSSSSSSSSTFDSEVLYSADDEPMSFYDLLGIPESGTLLEIKQAYKQLARKYHPDVSPPGRVEEYTQRFIQVQEAYETLSDPKLRALYDRDMAKGLHLAFSARRRHQSVDEEMEDKGSWKSRWQSQLSELKRRSMYKEASNDLSWGARMRRQRDGS